MTCFRESFEGPSNMFKSGTKKKKSVALGSPFKVGPTHHGPLFPLLAPWPSFFLWVASERVGKREVNDERGAQFMSSGFVGYSSKLLNLKTPVN